MFKILFTTLISVFIIGSTGCDTNTTQSNMALVVDLQAVARALGRDEEMTQKLEQARQLLSEQLLQIGVDLEKQLKEKETELGRTSKDDKDESREQLEQLTQQANIQLKKNQQLANQKAISYRDMLVDGFRKEVMTVAESIAHKHQAVAVYVTGSNLLWYSNTIDITDEVIGSMRAQANEMTKQGNGRSIESAAEVNTDESAVTE
jgi:Skp family chaperone for outer membrane proteins